MHCLVLRLTTNGFVTLPGFNTFVKLKGFVQIFPSLIGRLIFFFFNCQHNSSSLRMLKFLQFGGERGNWRETCKGLERKGGSFLSCEMQVPHTEYQGPKIWWEIATLCQRCIFSLVQRIFTKFIQLCTSQKKLNHQFIHQRYQVEHRSEQHFPATALRSCCCHLPGTMLGYFNRFFWC